MVGKYIWIVPFLFSESKLSYLKTKASGYENRLLQSCRINRFLFNFFWVIKWKNTFWLQNSLLDKHGISGISYSSSYFWNQMINSRKKKHWRRNELIPEVRHFEEKHWGREQLVPEILFFWVFLVEKVKEKIVYFNSTI